MITRMSMTSFWGAVRVSRHAATALDEPLANIEVIVAFARQTGECIGLLGLTLQDITLDSDGDTDPSVEHNEQRVAAVLVADTRLLGDA
jgi:hypothetical protein